MGKTAAGGRAAAEQSRAGLQGSRGGDGRPRQQRAPRGRALQHENVHGRLRRRERDAPKLRLARPRFRRGQPWAHVGRGVCDAGVLRFCGRVRRRKRVSPNGQPFSGTCRTHGSRHRLGLGLSRAGVVRGSGLRSGAEGARLRRPRLRPDGGRRTAEGADRRSAPPDRGPKTGQRDGADRRQRHPDLRTLRRRHARTYQRTLGSRRLADDFVRRRFIRGTLCRFESGARRLAAGRGAVPDDHGKRRFLHGRHARLSRQGRVGRSLSSGDERAGTAGSRRAGRGAQKSEVQRRARRRTA